MATTVDVVEFRRADPGPLVAVLDELAGTGDGQGWVNFGPALSEDEWNAVPHRSGLAAWVSGRGPAVPMTTWTPPRRGDRPRPAQVGVAHGAGPRALDRLAEAGTALPEGWTKRQDHAKHGIVAELPSGVDHRRVVEWALAAMTDLSERIAAGDEWMAEVHRPG